MCLPFKLGIPSHSGRSNGVPFLRRLHFYYHRYVVIQGFEITHAIFRVQFGKWRRVHESHSEDVATDNAPANNDDLLRQTAVLVKITTKYCKDRSTKIQKYKKTLVNTTAIPEV